METARRIGRWWRQQDPVRVDRLLAAAVAIAGLAEVLGTPDWSGDSRGVTAVTAVGCGVALLWRRRMPAVSQISVFALLLASRLANGAFDNTTCAFIAALLSTYAVGLYAPARVAAFSIAVSAGLFAIDLALNPEASAFNDVVFGLGLVFAAPFLAGRALRNRHLLTRELTEKAEALEAEREERAARAVVEERARIARELHDVVSHSVSLMVVQAGAARRVLDADPQAAQRSFATVEETGRAALVEMRRLLGILRRAEDEPALAPQPSLAYLDALLERARHAGLEVALRIEGERIELAPGLDLAAYRIIQEGLSNALRYSGAPRAIVTLRYGPRDLEIEVLDDGPIGEPPELENEDVLLGESRGMMSMRERVALYGGSLDAGRRRDGGFGLRARLPLQELAA